MATLGLLSIQAPVASAVTPPVEQRTPTTVTADSLPSVQIDGVVWDQIVVGNTVYAGGQFTNARPAGAAPGTQLTPRANLLAYDIRTGALITSFNVPTNGAVRTLALSPDKATLYIGGSFTKVGTQTHNRIAAISIPSGAVSFNFAPVLNTTVNSITVTSNAVYAGGLFTTASGAARNYAAAFQPVNGALLSWAPSFDYKVNALVASPDGSRIIVGGAFANANGSPVYGLASISTATGALLPMPANNVLRNYGASAATLSLTTDGTNVYGTAYWFGGTGNFEGVYAIEPNSGNIVWLADCHGDTYDANAINGVVYNVSHHHHCTNAGGFPDTNPRNRWQRASAFTADVKGTVQTNDQGGYYNFGGQPAPAMLNWFPTVPSGTFTGQNQGGWSIEGNSQYVVMGGEFPSVNGVAQQGIARFAVPSLAPKAQGPRVSGAPFNPRLQALSGDKLRIRWTSNWDRDDQDLTYEVLRRGVATPVYTTTGVSQFWNLPALYTDLTGLTPGATYEYRIRATDPDGNSVMSDYVAITMPTSVSPYASRILEDNAAHYWRMSESGTLSDYAGVADLSTNGQVSQSTDSAIGGDTNGSSTYSGSAASGTTTPETGPDSFAAEAWFKTTSTSGGKILGFGNEAINTSGSYDRHVYMQADGKITFGVYANAVRTVTSPAPYNDGQWHHVVMQMSGAGMALYLDGVKVASDAGTTVGQPYQGYWRVGGDNLNGWPNQPSSYSLAGQIDEVAIYPAPLSTGQIRAHYELSGRSANVPTPTDDYGVAVVTDDPQLFWRMDETSGSTTADASGNGVSGNYFGGATPGAASPVGKTGGAATVFNGSSAGVSSSSTFNNPSSYSIEAWFNTTTTAGGKIAGFGDQPQGTSTNYDRHVWMESNGQLRFGTWTGQTNIAATTVSYNDGEWHHMVATQGADGMKLYVDGQLAGSDPQTSAQAYTGYWRAGGDTSWGGNPFFAGSIDEFAIYGSVLSPARVTAHYQASGAAQNIAPVAAFAAPTCTEGECAFDASGSSDADGTIATYAWNFGDTETGTGVTPNHTYAASGTYQVTLTVTDNDGRTTTVTHPVTITVNVAPDAAFGSECTGLTCAFTNVSTDPDGSVVSQLWEFGDGATSTAVNPSHTYAGGGSFAVKLTVTDNGGKTNTQSHTVVVVAPNQAPVAAFTSDCTGLACSFSSAGSSDPDGTIASRAWTFGDTGTSTVANPSHTYTAAGTYTVTLTVTDDDGATRSVSHDVVVAAIPNEAPDAAFSSDCTGLTCAFDDTSTDSDGSVETWAWNFGDTQTSVQENPSHTYTAAGTYTVTLTVTDDDGSTNTQAHDVKVSSAPNQAPTAAFTESANALQVAFNAAGSDDPDGTIAGYAWNFGDGTTGTGSSTTHTYVGTGVYQVKLVVTDDDGATDDVTRRVVVSAGVVVASDAFGRTNATGWGSADTGGAWTPTTTRANIYSTNGQAGKVSLPTAGTGYYNVLGSVSERDLNVVAKVTLEPNANGGGSYTALVVRRQGDNEYQMMLRQTGGGVLRLQIIRKVGSTSTTLRDVAVPGAYTPGEVLRLRVVVSGNGTTAITGKAWRDGAAEPATMATASDSTAALQVAGAVGFYSYVSGSATNLPSTATLDDLLVTRV